MATFKSIEHQDIDIITQLMQDFYAIDNYPIDVRTTKKLFEEFILNENLGKSYLIYHDKELVGYFILTFVFSFEYKGRLAFLDELYIRESARGRGIGNQTMIFVKKIANQFDIKMMYLEVENHNQLAQKLYIANDYEFHDRKIMKHKF